MHAEQLRAQVRAAVEAVPCQDRRAVRSRARVLAELDRLPRPFDERADPVHVTASGIVTGPRGVLLHRHKRLGRWMQPGGHVDAGETPWDAVRREVFEEAGLRAEHPRGGHRLVHVDVHQAALGHVHLDLRYLLHADGEPDPEPGESQDVAWYGWDEAIGLADDALVGALRACAPPERGE